MSMCTIIKIHTWFFSLLLFLPNTQAQQYLSELSIQVPQSQGELIAIVGGTAVAERFDLGQNPYIDDQLIIVTAPTPTGDNGEWIWRRVGALGVDFNTDSSPIEFAWFPFQTGDDLAPFLENLKTNWGTTLIWRPAPLDAVMSFIDWGQMHIFKMKAPSDDIKIFNVPESDMTHLSTTGAIGQTVSHHRMWHFPHVPTGTLEVGEENSPHRVTFQDAHFDFNNPWQWSIGSKSKITSGGCPNPFYDASATDSQHESFYPLVRWSTYSGLIEILVPGGNSNAELQYPLEGIPIKLHSNFHHIWGAGFFALSTPLPPTQPDGSPTQGYSAGWAGNDAIALEVSGEFYDARLELRAAGVHNPAVDVWLKAPTFSDPYSQGTDYPGFGPAKRAFDGSCSSLTNPGFYPGVYGRVRGSATLEFGGATFGGFLHKNMHGEFDHQAFHLIYKDIGFTAPSTPIGEVLTWDTLQPSSASPKIDGFVAEDTFSLKPDKTLPPLRLKVDVIGKHKLSKVHTPLALEWGNDDSAGISLSRELFAEMNNSMFHFIPAPPLIPPTHSPITHNERLFVKSTHDMITIEANPWVLLYSNMTLLGDSVFPFSLIALGARDEEIPVLIDADNLGDTLVFGDFTIRDNPDVKHVVTGDAPPKVRLGNSNWAPPKYAWFQGQITFENVVTNGEILYSPAWGDYSWTLRFDQPLQAGVRLKLGQAQNYSGRHTGSGLWYAGQVVQEQNAYGSEFSYYLAVQDVPESTSVSNTQYWREIANPFAKVHFIYQGYIYDLPKEGAIVGSANELLHGDGSGLPLQAIAPAGGPHEGYTHLESIGIDNCPNDPNPYQSDTDGDGIGNVCDEETLDILANDHPNNDGYLFENISIPGTGIPVRHDDIFVGDLSNNIQYRGIVSFLLSDIVPGSLLSEITLKLSENFRVIDNTIVPKTTTLDTLDEALIDIKQGKFSNVEVNSLDFLALSNVEGAATLVETAIGAEGLLNQQGLQVVQNSFLDTDQRVQLRLRYSLPTDNDSTADYIRYYSVEDSDAVKPKLEIKYFLPDNFDSDGDFLNDGIEAYLGTNPFSEDTDADGLTDYEELGYDRNYTELSVTSDTNPLLADTDGDGLTDGLDPAPLMVTSIEVIPFPVMALFGLGFLILLGVKQVQKKAVQ